MLIKAPPLELADGVWMLGTNEYPVFLIIDANEGAIFEGGVGADGPIVKERLAAQLGAEAHEKIPLLPVDFFQKNCALMVIQSMKYVQENDPQ